MKAAGLQASAIQANDRYPRGRVVLCSTSWCLWRPKLKNILRTTNQSFSFAEILARLPRELFIPLCNKTYSGSKYPKRVYLFIGNRSTAANIRHHCKHDADWRVGDHVFWPQWEVACFLRTWCKWCKRTKMWCKCLHGGLMQYGARYGETCGAKMRCGANQWLFFSQIIGFVAPNIVFVSLS